MNESEQKTLQSLMAIAIVGFRLFATGKIMGVSIPMHPMKWSLLR